MADFYGHRNQVKSNLNFLQSISSNESKKFWDWKVTVVFYVGVHLVNAHIAKSVDAHYRSHADVDRAINPFHISPCKLPENVYLAYKKMQGLSRRSRYLVHDQSKHHSTIAHATIDKHFAKSIKHLDILMQYISSSYGEPFQKSSISCVELSNVDHVNFKVI